MGTFRGAVTPTVLPTGASSGPGLTACWLQSAVAEVATVVGLLQARAKITEER